MKNNQFRIILAIFSLVIALLLFFGIYTIYNKMGIESPVREQLFALNEVQDVHLEKIDRQQIIKVELNNSNNFKQVYKQVLEITDSKLEPNNYKLIIIDNRNTELTNLFEELHLSIYQAISNNEFIWLQQYLNEELNTKEVDYVLSVDDNYLYLHLTKNDYYLYEVLNRPSLNGEVQQ